MEIKTFFETLIDISDELFLVGGSVRDYLLKMNCYDYDFVLADKTIEIGKELANKTGGSFFILDHERKTVRVVWNLEGKIFNFDLARIIGNTVIEDLELRDITINSIAIKVDITNYENIINFEPIEDKYFIDPTNGINDIKQRLIKTFQKNNLSDDPLRMLRVFRFASKLNFAIEETTLNYIKELNPEIKNVAKERILKELFDLFYNPDSNKDLKTMIDSKLFESIFVFDSFDFEKSYKSCEFLKELENIIKNLDNHFKFSKEIDIYLSEILTLNHRKIECLKFSLLFSILKKENIADNKFITKLDTYLRNFTFSSNDQKFILRTINYSLNFQDIETLNLDRSSLYLFFKERKSETISSLIILYVISDSNLREKIKKIVEIYFSDPILSFQPEIINGNQIMTHFNLKAGKIIGELLEKVRQAQAEKIITNYDQAIEFINDILLSDNKSLS